MNLFRNIEPRIVPWIDKDNPKSRITHALVEGSEKSGDFQVFKTARSEQEAQLYLNNFKSFGHIALFPSESSKYLNVMMPYLNGNGVDLASGGWPVVEHAIQVELPKEEFSKYTGGRKPACPIHWQGDIRSLPFKDGVLDFVHVSHALEDFHQSEWPAMLKEWGRVLKPTGFLVVLVPEHSAWQHCIQVLGQCPNCSHAPPREPILGEMSAAAKSVGLRVIEERETNLFEFDYTILGVFAR